MKYKLANEKYFYGYWKGILSIWFGHGGKLKPYTFNTRAEAEFILSTLVYKGEELKVVEVP